MPRAGHVAEDELRIRKLPDALREPPQRIVAKGLLPRENGFSKIGKVQNFPASFPVFAPVGRLRPCQGKAGPGKLDEQASSGCVRPEVGGIEDAPTALVAHPFNVGKPLGGKSLLSGRDPASVGRPVQLTAPIRGIRSHFQFGCSPVQELQCNGKGALRGFYCQDRAAFLPSPY